MADVYLCEKELQAEDVADALGKYTKHKGYFLVSNTIYVTYAKGHLLELYKPDDYNIKLKSWKIEHLPIAPTEWHKKLKQSATHQFNVVKHLLETKASTIFIATDMDREGDSIAYDIIECCDITAPIKRIPVKSLDKESLEEALSNPLEYFIDNFSAKSADARRKADWLVGMNLTRLYTLIAQQLGMGDTYHVGRVTAPTIYIVNERCAKIRNHQPQPYHSLKVMVDTGVSKFEAKWVPDESYCDDKKRCINSAVRDHTVQNVLHQEGFIIKYESKERRTRAFLPFDLTSLQQLACERWGYTAKEVSTGLQGLYQNHKIITYPRTENRYLPSNLIDITDDILDTIENSGVHGRKIVSGVNRLKVADARVFNDIKVNDVHHAIIPTRQKVQLERLNTTESRLYHLVCRYFVAQFYPDYIYDQSEVELKVHDNIFRATGSKEITKGWKAVLGNNLALIEDSNIPTYEGQHPIPHICFGDRITISHVRPEDHATKPPDYFTESTLIKAMKRIGKYVDDEELRKSLDETAGLGTPATRAEIIETAANRGYFQREANRKRITDTQKGRDLMAILPNQITSPGTTALWEMRLEQIASGQITGEEFTDEISDWIESIVNTTKDAM